MPALLLLELDALPDVELVADSELDVDPDAEVDPEVERDREAPVDPDEELRVDERETDPLTPPADVVSLDDGAPLEDAPEPHAAVASGQATKSIVGDNFRRTCVLIGRLLGPGEWPTTRGCERVLFRSTPAAEAAGDPRATPRAT